MQRKPPGGGAAPNRGDNHREGIRCMAAISLRKVCKTFGATRVLRDIDLEISDGEFIAMVGPSGCGKSTLLNCIAGLEAVSAGRVFIGGRDVTALQPKDRDIAMVFQAYALYPTMTVRQNITFGMEIRNEPKARQEEALARVCAMLHIGDLLDRKPAQLSGGQRQRVAMGRAMVRDPAVFLFDEPLSNLDAKLRVQMRAELKAMHQRLRQTVVYVTHDQVEAMTLADRIVVMNAGQVAQVGTPAELYDRPRSLFVAGFIGSPAMNFLRGRLRPGAAGAPVAFEADDGTVLPMGDASAAPAGREVTLGVRPEHLALAQTGGVPMCVDVVEPMGDETNLHGHLAGAQVCVRLHRRVAVRAGDLVSIAWPPAPLHLFDAADGGRLEPAQGPVDDADLGSSRSPVLQVTP